MQVKASVDDASNKNLRAQRLNDNSATAKLQMPTQILAKQTNK